MADSEIIKKLVSATSKYGLLALFLAVVACVGVGYSHMHLSSMDERVNVLEASMQSNNQHIANIDGKLDILIELNSK